MIEKTLLNFCFNLEKFVTGRREKQLNSSLRSIQQGLSIAEPKTLGEKFSKALKENRIPLRYAENKDIIFDAIEARNAYLHHAELPKLTKYLVESLQIHFADLCINESRIKMDDVDLINEVYLKAVRYLQQQYNPIETTLGKIVVELSSNSEFEKIKYKFWNFARIRNHFIHIQPVLTPEEVKKINKFNRFLEERLMK